MLSPLELVHTENKHKTEELTALTWNDWLSVSERYQYAAVFHYNPLIRRETQAIYGCLRLPDRFCRSAVFHPDLSHAKICRKHCYNDITSKKQTNKKKSFSNPQPWKHKSETRHYQIIKGSLKKFASALSVYTRPQQVSLSQCLFDNRFN